jgi:hypothetical protein
MALPTLLSTVLSFTLMFPSCKLTPLYKIEYTPGWGSTLDLAAYLQALTTFILHQQKKDYDKLAGSRGMDK